jgi:hypothetical protein
MSDAASGSDYNPVHHGILDAALKFGVLPMTLADGAAQARRIEHDMDADHILRSMPATIHEVNKEVEG